MKKTILITGSRGFIGSNLKSKLLAKGYKISELSSNLEDHAAVAKEVRKINPTYVIHLSAVTTPSYYFDHPVETMQTNLIATVNLAEICRGIKEFKQFVFPSSVAVYAPMTGSKLNEKSKLQPLSSHGIAKMGCEYYLQYLNKIYGFPYTVLRLPNIYGRENNSKYFIEKTISLMFKGKSIKLGNPNAVRDWLYIEDALDAFIRVLGNERAIGQTFLIGTGKGHSTKDV
ncbi:MAG: SDR family oxidoreductase, partial [Candidatus Micrarchaeota archaeon]|nr:SDR family oxidoreductase [Candidatus Micrarchaeota archaeon]